MSSSACPYCFTELKVDSTFGRLQAGSASFRCVNPDQGKCKPEFDPKLATYQRTSPMLQPRTFVVEFSRFHGTPKTAACTCGYDTSKRICPECHNSLPSEFGSLDSFTIGLIGAKYTGKSNYIGVLIDRLSTEVSSSFGGSLNALDDQTSKNYRDNYKKHLFTEHAVVPVTDSAKSAVKAQYPLNYSFNRRDGKYFSTRRAVSLSLFDTAGEDLDDDDVVTTHVRYIGNAGGLIFLLDPLQLDAVRHSVSRNIPLPAVRTDPSEIIDRAIRILRKAHGLSASKKIPVPVAVVFSKIDAVRDLVEKDSPLHHTAAHNGRYDEVDGELLHQSIRSYLAQWGALAVDNTLAAQFGTYRYFGMSSFGYAPKDDQLSKGIAPFRVEDPFLWLLAQEGFIGKTKRGKTP